MSLTLEDIAKQAGVSRSTVSRVVNQHPNVSPAVRKRVLDIIQATGFQPHAAARTLASRRSMTIGLILPHSVSYFFTDPYFPHLTKGIAQACKRYLKPGGWLLSNDHQHDAGQAARDPDFTLIAVIRDAAHNQKIDTQGLAQYFIPLPQPVQARLTRGHANPVRRYTQHADYYIFQKTL